MIEAIRQRLIKRYTLGLDWRVMRGCKCFACKAYRTASARHRAIHHRQTDGR